MDKDPEKNLPKLLDRFDMFDIKGTLLKECTAVSVFLDTGGKHEALGEEGPCAL